MASGSRHLALPVALLLAATSLSLTTAPVQATTASPSPSASPSASASASPSPSIPAPKGDSIRARQYWLTQYGFDELWEEATGKGVTVAVIDTGVDARHQDLAGRVLAGYDASLGGAGGTASPVPSASASAASSSASPSSSASASASSSDRAKGWEGLGLEPEHGTLVASLIAGAGHQDSSTPSNRGEPGGPAGIMGIAPEAKILPISLELGSASPKTRSVDEQIPEAVRYAVDQGAHIINLSVGSDKTSWPQSWDSAFAYAEEKGVIIVASAGNRGAGLTQVGAPATMPGVLTVGGVDQNRKDSWSDSSQGISIAVSAPSQAMIGAIPGNRYATWSGTSAAAPIVSGLAALIKEKYPDLTGNQIIQRIISSADDAGADGRDPLYGYGIINPAAALDPKTPDDTSSNPLGSMQEWIRVHRKNTTSPSPSSSETPIHQEGEELETIAAPTPVRPAADSGILPPLILAGLALWVGIITLGSIGQLKRWVASQEAKRK